MQVVMGDRVRAPPERNTQISRRDHRAPRAREEREGDGRGGEQALDDRGGEQPCVAGVIAKDRRAPRVGRAVEQREAPVHIGSSRCHGALTRGGERTSSGARSPPPAPGELLPDPAMLAPELAAEEAELAVEPLLAPEDALEELLPQPPSGTF